MSPDEPTVFIVDDHGGLRKSMAFFVRSAGFQAETFESGAAFLKAYDAARPGCLVLDLQMPGMSGLQVLEHMAAKGDCRPVIMVSAHGDVPTAVQALKTGAVDFVQKPFKDQELLERIRQAIGLDAEWRRWQSEAREVLARLGTLTPREREVFDLTVDGLSIKEMAERLGAGTTTIETHRRHVLQKMQARSAVDLARLASLCRNPWGPAHYG
ncbi:MAG: response regulator transcription factor [Rhodospirillales bacterium]|nr:response regulator transcription factor [Rhodospirillales bacterium]